jgi:flagellar hook assembly protein FlgD
LAAVPDPFNPTATLAFEMAGPGDVHLTVFDTAGRWVTTLVERPREAGVHRVVRDGRDSGGRRVASGPYIYRLEAGDDAETRRMALIK